MAKHNLFYYPYASFTNEQLPLLKVAALYFDKLVMLDPVGASWDTVGADSVARDAVRLLKDAGILEIVTPATVLESYATPITDAIRRDMCDPEFQDLCAAHSQATGKQRWTLALSKVPRELQTDQAMRHLMGDFAKSVCSEAAKYGEQTVEYEKYAEMGQSFDEYREGYDADVEYRYADYPLALGEAIMMNHALFAGLLYSDATPVTDDPFHNQALALKLRRASQDPDVLAAQANPARTRQLKADQLAVAALSDSNLKLPILSPELPLQEILEYRQQNDDALQQTRDKLGWMAQRVKAEPWSAKFAKDLEHETIPDLAEKLDEAGQARDAWLKSKRGRLRLSGTGIAVGAASALLSFCVAPVTPVVLAAATLGLVSGSVIPGAEWLLDWRDGKQTLHENGLHFLITEPASKKRK